MDRSAPRENLKHNGCLVCTRFRVSHALSLAYQKLFYALSVDWLWHQLSWRMGFMTFYVL